MVLKFLSRILDLSREPEDVAYNSIKKIKELASSDECEYTGDCPHKELLPLGIPINSYGEQFASMYVKNCKSPETTPKKCQKNKKYILKEIQKLTADGISSFDEVFPHDLRPEEMIEI